jgi:hypothetical protein
VASLEGGYHAEVLGASVAATLHSFLDASAPIVDPFGATHLPAIELTPTFADIRAYHGM